jgi:hypothetical protein
MLTQHDPVNLPLDLNCGILAVENVDYMRDLRVFNNYRRIVLVVFLSLPKSEGLINKMSQIPTIDHLLPLNSILGGFLVCKAAGLAGLEGLLGAVAVLVSSIGNLHTTHRG